MRSATTLTIISAPIGPIGASSIIWSERYPWPPGLPPPLHLVPGKVFGEDIIKVWAVGLEAFSQAFSPPQGRVLHLVPSLPVGRAVVEEGVDARVGVGDRLEVYPTHCDGKSSRAGGGDGGKKAADVGQGCSRAVDGCQAGEVRAGVGVEDGLLRVGGPRASLEKGPDTFVFLEVVKPVAKALPAASRARP